MHKKGSFNASTLKSGFFFTAGAAIGTVAISIVTLKGHFNSAVGANVAMLLLDRCVGTSGVHAAITIFGFNYPAIAKGTARHMLLCSSGWI